MAESRDIRIKRLLYQSWYRGCKETDRILGHFARVHIEALSDSELDEFEAILEENDKDLFNWLSGNTPLPERYEMNKVMQKLAAFDVAAANQN